LQKLRTSYRRRLRKGPTPAAPRAAITGRIYLAVIRATTGTGHDKGTRGTAWPMASEKIGDSMPSHALDDSLGPVDLLRIGFHVMQVDHSVIQFGHGDLKADGAAIVCGQTAYGFADDHGNAARRLLRAADVRNKDGQDVGGVQRNQAVRLRTGRRTN
jgi:hypothetical protein